MSTTQPGLDRTSLVILVLALLAAMGGFWAGLHFFGADPARGLQAPELVLRDHNGRMVKLSDYRGTPVLINFWASWCSPCIAEMPMLDAFAKSRSGEIKVIGITEDEAEPARAWLKENPVSYPILQSPSPYVEISMGFGNNRRVLPYSVLLDAQGQIVRSHAGMFQGDQLERFVR